jgi:hypothetical protein
MWTKYILLSFILTFSSPVAQVAQVEEAAFVPRREPEAQACWISEPAIRVCDGLNISSSRISLALRYWERLGYSFGPIIYDNSSPACRGNPLWGEIILSLPNQSFDFEKLALTRTTKLQVDNTILYSQIFLQERYVSKERVLEHEIGHALGWSHTSMRYHLMNEAWENGGHNSSGLKYRRYIELCQDSLE